MRFYTWATTTATIKIWSLKAEWEQSDCNGWIVECEAHEWWQIQCRCWGQRPETMLIMKIYSCVLVHTGVCTATPLNWPAPLWSSWRRREISLQKESGFTQHASGICPLACTEARWWAQSSGSALPLTHEAACFNHYPSKIRAQHLDSLCEAYKFSPEAWSCCYFYG